MSIEIQNGRYFSAMWFVKGPDCDWHAALYRDEKNENLWTVKARMRLYKDDKHHESEDEKIWHTGVFNADVNEAQAFHSVAKLAREVSDTFKAADPSTGEIHTCHMNTDVAEKVMKVLLAQPWAKGRPATPEEVIALKGN